MVAAQEAWLLRAQDCSGITDLVTRRRVSSVSRDGSSVVERVLYVIEFLQICIGGLVVGSIYAAIALGFSLVYRVTAASPSLPR
jgi:hypothetical protein